MGKTVIKYNWGPINLIATIFAMMVSWFYNKSILWLIFHGIFSWFYLIYCIFDGKFSNGGFSSIIQYYFS